jgi:hypothetical protein
MIHTIATTVIHIIAVFTIATTRYPSFLDLAFHFSYTCNTGVAAPSIRREDYFMSKNKPSAQQRAHDLALIYMAHYIDVQKVDTPEQTIEVYQKVYDNFLSKIKNS